VPAPVPAAAPTPASIPALRTPAAPRPAAATQITPQEPARAPERRAEASVPIAVAAAPVLTPIAVVREEPRPLPVVAQLRPEPLPGPTGTEPSLNDAQPLLTQLLQSMEGGSGEQILRLLETDARRAPAAVALSRHYDHLVGRARPIRLSHVEFRSEAREGVLLVTGRVRLHAGEQTIGAHGERMSLRAEFVSRGGKVMLTGLSAGAE
jgi:hypothetical protein